MALKIDNSIIPDEVINRWQDLVDTISDLVSVPSVMINRIDPPILEVLRSNVSPDNPFPTGTQMPLMGIYCEMTARTRQKNQVADARKDPRWANSPTAKAGIYSYLGYPLLWPDGSVFGTLCMVDTKEHDWDARTQELVAVFREAIETHLALAYANEAAKAASRAKSEFLANMSHEIRTPMTAILGFSDVLMEGELSEEQKDAAATIKRNGEYLIGLINDILDLSKIEAGKLAVERIACSPCQILADVASLMRVRAKAKGLAFEIVYDGPIPQTIRSDPTRLRQILINLAGNAVKFTETGNISLTARLLAGQSRDPMLQFDVTDSGIGMTEEEIARLFQPFSQADTSTTRKHGGTGLGLTISKRLAEELGGGIAVRSTPGKGSTFTATIETGPLYGVRLVACPTEAQLSMPRERRPAAERVKLECRVLLAEDGLDNQRLISFFLRKCGVDVTVAETGRAACDLALAALEAGDPFAVILMDMQMPVMDGYSATRELRDAGYTGPIIALTAHAMTADRDKCLRAGCNDYTTKPIDRDKLLSLVAKYARRRNPCCANTL